MVGDYFASLDAASHYLPLHPHDANTRWAVALAQLQCGDHSASIDTARTAVATDPADVTLWHLLGYLLRIGGDEANARETWSAGIEQILAGAETVSAPNPRVQSWLANLEACLGRTDEARARVASLTTCHPNNGYLKYRLTHVLAELGDERTAIKTLRHAVLAGFRSVQLLRNEERLGLSRLLSSEAYGTVRGELEQDVEQLRYEYTPASGSFENDSRPRRRS
jgi:Flp pilus assembly protein TadD